MRPQDVPNSGRMAFVSDPTGAMVGIWQAGKHIGATLANEPNTVIWNECFTDDIETAGAFYDAVFGTETQAMDMGADDPYVLLQVGEDAVGGYMKRDPEAHGEVPNAWLTCFATADINATVDVINAGGGKVLNGPFDTPPGPMIVAQDPQGAVFQVMQPATKPPND